MQNDNSYVTKTNHGIYNKYLKRPMDFILSLISIILLSPIIVIIAFIVKLKLGSPVIFKHHRPGLNEEIFTMYKFRSMTDEKDDSGKLLPSRCRLTKFGKTLRLTSLDELPGLFNILLGDMSFIGPRPLLTEYLPLYNEKQRRRHDVRPGLSGLAQVNGRNTISWEDKFNYDIDYVENVSFCLDFKIALRTIIKVFKREGVNKSENEIMDKFRGNDKQFS